MSRHYLSSRAYAFDFTSWGGSGDGTLHYFNVDVEFLHGVLWCFYWMNVSSLRATST